MGEQSEQSEEVRTMFVGGLTGETTEQEINAYFGKYGVIENTKILKKENQGQASRVFGFVTFTDMEALGDAFLERPHKLKGSPLDIKHAVPKGYQQKYPGATNKTKKLFIANLSPNTTEEDVVTYLKKRHPCEKYGTVEKINLIKKKENPDELKGFGFIECSSEDFADKVAIHDNKFQLNSKTIELKKSDPKVGQGGGGYQRGGMRGGYGGGYQSGGYGGGGYQSSGYGGGYQAGGYGGGYGYDPYGYYAGGYGTGYGGKQGQQSSQQGGQQGGRGGGRGRGRGGATK